MQMATENPPKICVQSKFVETCTTLDLSQIIDNIDTFFQGDVIKTKMNVGDIVFDIDFYPKGNAESDTVSIFVSVPRIRGSVKGSGNDKKIDNREMYVRIKHTCNVIGRFMETIDDLSSEEVGFDNISLSSLKNHPNLEINIKLFGDPLFVSKEDMKMQSFSNQHEMMHKLSLLHGDVTLIAKVNPENGTNTLYVPPQKKRKLNESNECTCNVCNKAFASTKALTSHMSNKKDTEHINYKNSIKKNLDIDSDCVIKMSSIVLRAASKVFDRMLCSNMIEKQQKTIEIQAKSVEDVKHLAYFMTTNELKESDTINYHNLIELAHYYEMERLFWKCVYALIRHVTVQNFAQTLRIFDKYEIKKGYDVLVKFAKKNIEALKKADDFETISHAFKCACLVLS
eukprot:1042678_1